MDGFGKKMAEKVVQCFPEMTTFLKTCVDNGLQLEGVENIVTPASSAGPLSSLTQEARSKAPKVKICLSGFRDKKLEKKYQVLSSVTKECEILVCKSFEKETGKMTKAKSLNVKMVLLEDFE